MAASPSFPAPPSMSLSIIHPPPPSQDNAMQDVLMPDVFVIPPEEEQNETPPWCYFNAADAVVETHSVKPNIDAIDAALSLHQQLDNRSPAFHRSLQNESQETVVLPRRASVVRFKENDTSGEARLRSRHRLMDEDVVEVVKVRRDEGRGDFGEMKYQSMKKSKTFRARATNAFKSIKNVGKGTRKASSSSTSGSIPSMSSASGGNQSQRDRIRVSDAASKQESLPRPGTPNLSRRRSLVLAQLFTFSPNGRTDSSASGEVDELAVPVSLAHRHNMHTMPSLTSPPPASQPRSFSQSHAHRLRPSPSIEDYGEPLATFSGRASPNPALSKRKSFRRRISVLDLQKLFSPSGSSTTPTTTSTNSLSSLPPQQDHTSPEPVADIFAPSPSDPLFLVSSASASSEPATPLSCSTHSSASSFSQISANVPSCDDMAAHESDCDSLEEMQLDSLHFDSLHFDPDDF